MKKGCSLRAWLAAGMLLVALTGSACRPPGVAGPQEPSDPTRLEPGIVRTVDLIKVPGVELMERIPSAQIPDSTGPNLRGACGEAIPPPETSNRLVAVFLGESSAFTEAIVEAGEDDARAFLQALKEDARPGCEPQTVITEDGQSQVYTQGPIIDVGDLGDDRLVTLATLDFDDQTLYVGTILIRSGGIMIQALYSSENPVDESTVAALAEVLYEAGRDLLEESG